MSIIEKLGKAGVPGFRSGKKWKIVIASIVYFFIIMNVLVISLAIVLSSPVDDSSVAPANIPATSTPSATQAKVEEESAPTVEEVVQEPIKSGLTQEHINQVSEILLEAGYANLVEAEGSVMYVSLNDETLTWYDIETLTRSLTKYVYNNAGTGTATVSVYVDEILMAEGKYNIWSGSIEVELKR